MTAIPRLETERLVLRAPRPGDFGPYAAFFASARAERERGVQDRCGAWAEFCKAIAPWVLYGYGAFSVAGRADETYLGEVGIFRDLEYPEPELGWMLTEAAEGHGYAAEAALAVRAWAAEAHGLTGLVSYINPGNARSIRLAERLGALRDDAAPLPGGWTRDTTLVYRHPGAEARA